MAASSTSTIAVAATAATATATATTPAATPATAIAILSSSVLPNKEVAKCLLGSSYVYIRMQTKNFKKKDEVNAWLDELDGASSLPQWLNILKKLYRSIIDDIKKSQHSSVSTLKSAARWIPGNYFFLPSETDDDLFTKFKAGAFSYIRKCLYPNTMKDIQEKPAEVKSENEYENLYFRLDSNIWQINELDKNILKETTILNRSFGVLNSRQITAQHNNIRSLQTKKDRLLTESIGLGDERAIAIAEIQNRKDLLPDFPSAFFSERPLPSEIHTHCTYLYLNYIDIFYEHFIHRQDRQVEKEYFWIDYVRNVEIGTRAKAVKIGVSEGEAPLPTAATAATP